MNFGYVSVAMVKYTLNLTIFLSILYIFYYNVSHKLFIAYKNYEIGFYKIVTFTY